MTVDVKLGSASTMPRITARWSLSSSRVPTAPPFGNSLREPTSSMNTASGSASVSGLPLIIRRGKPISDASSIRPH
jgi:hypothetical protein